MPIKIIYIFIPVLVAALVLIVYNVPQILNVKTFNNYANNINLRYLFFPRLVDANFTRQEFLDVNSSLCERQVYLGRPFGEKISEYKFNFLEPLAPVYYVPCQLAPDGVRGIPFFICGHFDTLSGSSIFACSLDSNSTKELFNITSPEQALEYTIFLNTGDTPFIPLIADKEYDDLIEQEGKDCRFIKNVIIKGARVQGEYVVEFNYHNLNSGTLDYLKVQVDKDGSSQLLETYPLTNSCLSVI